MDPPAEPVAYRFRRSVLVAAEALWPDRPDRESLIRKLLDLGELVAIPEAE